MSRSHEMDMTSGPLLSKVFRFSIPLMLSGILQLLFNAADVIVVGKFCGSLSLAAVGSNGNLINLLIGMFISVSTGVNVLVARYFGEKNPDAVSRCVHTAIAMSIVLGVLVGIGGFFASTAVLELMNVDAEVLPLSRLYLNIYFLGVPATLVYNFGAAVLRAIGDTKRPMYFLILAGAINVVLNLILVVFFHMDVAGVAIATVVSQYLSAILVVLCLLRTEGWCQLHLGKLCLARDMIGKILQIGFPAGIQSIMFSISNVIIQSSINSFGYIAMAGNSAAASIDAFIYTANNAFYHAALCFTSQNVGAKRLDRVPKVMSSCVILTVLVTLVITPVVYLFGPELLSLYISGSDPDRDAVIAAGMIRLTYVGLPYFLCGLMEVGCGMLRGLGRAWSPMIISIVGSCVLRLVWIYTIFAAFRSMEVLYLSYTISWIMTMTAHYLCTFFVYRKEKAALATQAQS